jgi:hypothetical protein
LLGYLLQYLLWLVRYQTTEVELMLLDRLVVRQVLVLCLFLILLRLELFLMKLHQLLVLLVQVQVLLVLLLDLYNC